MPRVLVDLRHLVPPVTGMGRYALSVVRELARRGPGLELGVVAPPQARELLWQAGIGVTEVPARYASHEHPWVWLEGVLAGRRRAAGFAPDVVWGPAYAFPPAPSGVPVVVTVADLACVVTPETMPRRFAWLLRRRIDQAVGGAAEILVLSKHVERQLLAHRPAAEGRITVVEVGIEAEYFAATDRQAEEARRIHGLPERYVLAVGGDHPRKGLGRLREALAAIPGAPALVVAGEPRPTGPGVMGLGYVEDRDLPGLYRGARLLAFPSLDEGYGIPPLEAMAAGTPVVASATGGLPEALGEEARLVPPGDGTALEAALRQELGEPWPDPARRERLRAKVIERTWARVAEVHEGVFRRLAGTRAERKETS